MFDIIHSFVNIDVVSDLNKFKSALNLVLISTGIICFSYSLTAINQGFQSSLGVGLIYLITTLTELIVLIGLLILDFGLLSFGISMLYKGILLTILNLLYFVWRIKRDNFHIFLSVSGFSDLTKKVLFNFFSKSIDGISKNLDYVLLNNFLGSQYVPILSVTKKSFILVKSFLERPVLALFPTISNLYGTGDVVKTRTIILQLLKIITWTGGLSVTGLHLFNFSFISLLVGSDLYAGYIVNNTLIISLIITLLSNNLSTLCYSLGNIKGNSIIVIVQSIISIPLMYLGVKYFGMVGAVVFPVIPVFFISLTYFFLHLIKKLQLSPFDLLHCVFELVPTILTSIFTVLILKNLIIESWYFFTMIVFSYIFIFFFVLFLLSKSFRYDILYIFKEVKLRFT